MSSRLNKQLREINDIHLAYLNQARPLSHEQLNKKTAEGQWSFGQVLFHLINAYGFTQSFMEKRIAENKVTQHAGIKNLYRSLLLQLALASPMKFKAPRSVAAVPEELQFQELENSFRDASGKFEKMLAELPDGLEDKEIFKHPRAGYLNAAQTLNFIRSHALHHKPQIDGLLKSI